MARRSAKKGNSRSVDFSQEVKWFEADQDYEVEVKTATWEDGQEYPYIAIEFKGVDEDNEESSLYHNATASPKALHRLRALLEALGVEVEKGSMDIDTDDLVGRRCMLHTYKDSYTSNDGEKKTTIRADDFWPVEETKGADKKDAKKADPAETFTEADVKDMSRKELIKLIDKYEFDVDPESRKLRKDDEALAEAVIEALEDKSMIEKEKEEKKAPAGRSSRGSGKSKEKQTWKEDDIGEMSEEELDGVVEAAGLDIDLSEERTLRKKRNVLIDALEEKELLEK